MRVLYVRNPAAADIAAAELIGPRQQTVTVDGFADAVAAIRQGEFDICFLAVTTRACRTELACADSIIRRDAGKVPSPTPEHNGCGADPTISGRASCGAPLDLCGAAAIDALSLAAPDLAIVALIDKPDEDLARAIVRSGAQDHVVDEKVDPTALVRFARHAIERKRMEVELRSSRQRFVDFARSASDWFWEADADLRFTYFSEQWATLTGLPRDLLIGMNRQDVVSSGIIEAEVLAAHIADLEARRPFRDFEYVLPTPDGRSLVMRISGVPVFDPRGRFLGYRGTGREVSAIKQAERELRESKLAAEAASRAKSHFLANMSHELRTPLNAIIGFSQVIEEEILGPTPEKYREYAGDIHSSGEHLLSIINSILDLSKVEAGRWTLEPQTVDVVALVDTSLTMVRPQAEERGLRIEWVAPPAATVVVDPIVLKQCLVNLLSNAVKFSIQGGCVSVAIAIGKDGAVAIVVRDDGIGIPEEALSRLGKPFEQVAHTTVSKYQGTGLGLALTRGLMSQMGGIFLLESTVGHGTVATLRLPSPVPSPHQVAAE